MDKGELCEGRTFRFALSDERIEIVCKFVVEVLNSCLG